MLTAVKIKNAKPKDRQYKLADAQGLYLLVRPNGSKLWQYQYQIGNSRKTFSVGAWPDVSLAEARSARMAGRNLVRQGIDPMDKRKVAVEAETGKVTFGEIADEYIERMEAEGRAERTVRKNSWLLKDVGRSIRSTPIEDLKAAEILTLLKKVEATGKLETARRLRTVIGCVFRFAIATLRAENDPTVLLRGSLRNVPALRPLIAAAQDEVNHLSPSSIIDSIAWAVVDLHLTDTLAQVSRLAGVCPASAPMRQFRLNG